MSNSTAPAPSSAEAHTIPRDVHLRQSRLYRTCRNWQFAWWLPLNKDAPDAPPMLPDPLSGDPNQLSLI
jgi:hypothetical protein